MDTCAFCIAKMGFVLVMLAYLGMEIMELCAPGQDWLDLTEHHRKRRGYN